jgi:cytochrome c-type biogenesis protein CcmE
MRKPSTKVLISIGLIGTAIAVLIAAGTTTSGNTTHYYHTTSEFLARAPQYVNNSVRVNGRVVPGSLGPLPGTSASGTEGFVFALGDSLQRTLRVHYKGTTIPDAFREGADLVVEGIYTPSGVLEARQLLVKCPSKYEAAPANK